MNHSNKNCILLSKKSSKTVINVDIMKQKVYYINLQEIKGKKAKQIGNGCKKIEYKELVCLQLRDDEFYYACMDLFCSTVYYADYARYSTADTDGRWRCIVLKNIRSGEKLIIYTGGRLLPLYVTYEGCINK